MGTMFRNKIFIQNTQFSPKNYDIEIRVQGNV